MFFLTNIAFQIDDDNLQQLDDLASTMDRDRSYLINEAVDHCLEMKQWHIAETRKSIAETDAGKFSSPEQLRAFFRMAREQS
jgi:predicted transcriptional regulator